MGRKSSIRRLPEKVRNFLEGELASGQHTLDELIDLLREQFPAHEDDLPSRSAVHRYGQQLERRLAAIRASTEAAKIIRAQAGDREDARSEALTAMIQSELFESIMDMQEAPDMDPQKRVAMLSSAAKNIATLTRSSVSLKKYQEEAVAARLAEQEKNLEEVAQAQGMDADQVTFWREKVLGIR
ncbi:DUF3486 family protein [Marinobacter sp.]|uniref:DUF3486 family protein n=1 Tax=Marinobacter sp. TaxID=50741 RepID=UPI0034A5D2AC